MNDAEELNQQEEEHVSGDSNEPMYALLKLSLSCAIVLDCFDAYRYKLMDKEKEPQFSGVISDQYQRLIQNLELDHIDSKTHEEYQEAF